MAHELCKNLYITDIGYYPNAQYHNRERKKGCQQNILIYCAKGSGWYQIGGQCYTLQANEIVILPQKTAHKYGADKNNPWTIYWVHFAGNNANAIIHHLQKNGSNNPLMVPLNEERNGHFEKMINLLEMADNMDNMVDAFLAFPYYLTSFKQPLLTQAKQLAGNHPIEQSIAFMKTNIDKMLTLRSLAIQALLSVSHYSTLFQQKTHNSPINYFIFLKMQYACQLLQNTNLPIKQIGLTLGYEDPFHFSRTFTKVIGVSPRGFRTR